MSGYANISAVPDQNILYNAASGLTATNVMHNQLLNQGAQQDIGLKDMATVGQAGAALLNMNEDQAAAAYGPMRDSLQAQGFGKNLPATYPGHAATQAFVQRAMPILQQIQTGFLTTPGSADATKRLNDIYTGAGTPPTAPATSGAPATGDGLTGDKAHDLPLIAQRESGGNPTVLNYVARQDPTAYGRGATASGKYQIVNSTWREGMQLAGLDPAQYATARDAPEQVQDKVASAIYDKYGAKPWQKGPQDWVKDEQGRYQMATVRPPAGAPGGAPSTPSPGGPGGPATPAPYRVASNAPTAPPAATAPAAAPIPRVDTPGAPPAAGLKYNITSQGAPKGTILGYLPNGTAVLAGQTDAAGITGWNADGTPIRGGAPAATPQPTYTDTETGLPVIGTQPGAPAATPQPQAQVPQPPANRVMPGAADGPPAPTPPPAAQPPGARPNLPRAADVPSGANSPQVQQAQDLLHRAAQLEMVAAQNPYDKRLQADAAAKAADLKQRAQILMQTDSVVQTQEGQLHPLTGKIDDPTKPNANYVWSPEQRAYIDTTGTHPPVTPPSPRFSPPTVDPATGKPAVAVEGGQGGTKYLPIPDRPATATFDLQKEQHKRDTDELPKYNEQNQQAAANQIRIQQMRELVDQITTGAGGAERANWANIAEQMGWTDLSKRLIGMGGAAAAQEFAKYGLATAGAQERGDLGARGSLGAITLYKSANPGLELQPDANKKMLTAQLIAAQANRDYTQGAMDYVNRNGDAFVVHGANYTPLSHFDAEWAAQRSPQIYAAAMSAINGDPWQKWTKALNMKDATDVQRVVDIVRRADPTSSIMWKNGEPHDVGTSQ